MLRKACATLFVALTISAAASAQEAKPVHIYGPIAKVDGQAITVKDKNGKPVSFDMTPNARIVSNVPIEIGDIKAGDYIAIDTVKKGGKDVAIQAHIQEFAHGANAANQRPMMTHKGATRSLGQVTSVKTVKDGIEVDVTGTKGGEMDFVLTPNIVRYRNEVESASDLKPGTLLMTNATEGKGGKLRSGFITIAKNGHKPVDIGY